jgi:hypothetical protein
MRDYLHDYCSAAKGRIHVLESLKSLLMVHGNNGCIGTNTKRPCSLLPKCKVGIFALLRILVALALLETLFALALSGILC